MKYITVLEDVDMPGVPGLKKGAEVRICKKKADILIERGLAKPVTGKIREEVERGKVKKTIKEVEIKKLLSPRS